MVHRIDLMEDSSYIRLLLVGDLTRKEVAAARDDAAAARPGVALKIIQLYSWGCARLVAGAAAACMPRFSVENTVYEF